MAGGAAGAEKSLACGSRRFLCRARARTEQGTENGSGDQMLVFHEQSSELAAARQGTNTSRADRFDNRRIVGVCRRDLPVELPSCNELSQSMLDADARETGWPGATGPSNDGWFGAAALLRPREFPW